MKYLNPIIEALLRGLSRLPLRGLYLLSSAGYFIIYYLVRYRRRIVRKNISRSFPQESAEWQRRVERDFYRFFCDYVVETVKLLSMSREEMMRRMTFEGIGKMEEELKEHDFVFIYLGHYCNWEWVSSLPQWFSPATHGAQLYRPLNNQAFDRLFMHIRTRFGAENISKYESLRRILQLKAEGKKTIIGFISDQSPKPDSIHDWVPFLCQDTPVFTGTERIGKKVDAAIYFADMKRVGRGHYHCTMRHMTSSIKAIPDYRLTERYMQMLEAMIKRQPHLWLWSHNRWKHHRNSTTG